MNAVKIGTIPNSPQVVCGPKKYIPNNTKPNTSLKTRSILPTFLGIVETFLFCVHLFRCS